MVENVVVAAEDAVRQPVVPQELPDVLDRVQLGAFRWQRDEGDVGRYLELVRRVPSGLVEQEDGMRARRHGGRDLGEVEAHRLSVAVRQDEAYGLARLGTDSAEDVGRRRPLVMRRRGSGAAPGPTPGDLILLPNSGLVGEPDLYGAGGDAFRARDFLQEGGKGLFKRSTAPSAC